MLVYLLLYFQLGILFILALFGLHRLLMIRSYFQLKRAASRTLQSTSEYYPSVTVQIPLYNEYAIAQRVIEHAARIEYPLECFEIQVLDDSDAIESQDIARKCVARLAQQGLPISYHHRSKRPGFKAGALEAGAQCAKGEFLFILDADFLPRTDVLKNVMGHFKQERLAMIQFRWEHLNANQNLLTRAQACLLDAHFIIEQSVRSGLGLFFNFNGTAGIWRKSAIERAGGWQGDTLTEDLDLSYRAQLAGFRFLYLNSRAIPAELPVNLKAFRSQQHRWTKGATEVLTKLGGSILHSKESPRRKLEALVHLGSNLCYPLVLMAGLCLLPSILAFQNLKAISSIPLIYFRLFFLFGFSAVALFYLLACLESPLPKSRRSIFVLSSRLILALLAGVALSLSNSLAVCEALFKKKSPFIRTPKSGSCDNAPLQERYASQLHLLEDENHSQKRFSLFTFTEAALCLYFGITLSTALYFELYEAVPFTLLFFCGYLWFFLESLRSFSYRRPRFKAGNLAYRRIWST